MAHEWDFVCGQVLAKTVHPNSGSSKSVFLLCFLHSKKVAKRETLTVSSPCLDAAWEVLGYLGSRFWALLYFKGALLRLLKSEICFNWPSLG